MLTVWGALVGAAAWWNAWTYLIVLYVLPGMLAGNLQSLRKYIEHMGLTGATVLSSTRSVSPSGLLGRLFALSLFNIPYHGVHHQYAGMPQAKMPEFTDLLIPKDERELPPYRGYWRAFRDMLWTLPDPRVGSQWLRS